MVKTVYLLLQVSDLEVRFSTVTCPDGPWLFNRLEFPNVKVCDWICLTLQSQMTRSALTISSCVIYVWICRDILDFFNSYLSGRPIYVWLCRDFDFHTEQWSAENRPTFRCIHTGLLSRERSKIFIRVLLVLRFKPPRYRVLWNAQHWKWCLSILCQ